MHLHDGSHNPVYVAPRVPCWLSQFWCAWLTCFAVRQTAWCACMQGKTNFCHGKYKKLQYTAEATSELILTPLDDFIFLVKYFDSN